MSVDAPKFQIRNGRLQPNRRSTSWPRSAVTTTLIAGFYEINKTLFCGDLLDAGSGTSPLEPFYAPLCDSVTRLDWSHSPHDTNLDVIADLNAALPFANGSFDTVLLSDVLEHLREPAVALSESWRVLRTGGHLVSNVPFAYPLHELPHDYFRFTQFGLEHLANKSGFGQISVVALGGIPDVAADVLLKAADRRRLRAVGNAFVKCWLGAPRALRQAGSGRLPLAYGLIATKTPA